MTEMRRQFEEFISKELPDEILFLAADFAIKRGMIGYQERKLEAYGFIAGWQAAWNRRPSVDEIREIVLNAINLGDTPLEIAQVISAAMGGNEDE